MECLKSGMSDAQGGVAGEAVRGGERRAAALRNPFVVQCAGCARIVADSFSLEGVRGAYLVHSECMFSEEGAERALEGMPGSWGREVRCGCGRVLGWRLVSAGEGWNGCTGRYLIGLGAVGSYELGRGEKGGERALGAVAEDVERLKEVVARLYQRLGE